MDERELQGWWDQIADEIEADELADASMEHRHVCPTCGATWLHEGIAQQAEYRAPREETCLACQDAAQLAFAWYDEQEATARLIEERRSEDWP